MPPPSSTLIPRIKVQLKLSIARLRMVQKRDEALAKTQRRAMAQLLEQGKIDSARIRVENIIRSDIITELHEMLELYCELLLARAGLLAVGAGPASSSSSSSATDGQQQQQQQQQVCDPGLEEAVHSIIYAAPRTEIKELQQVRALLAERFGKEYVLRAAENRDGKVSERVLCKLSVAPPRQELVQGYLEEIAKAYGVDWPPGRLKAEAEAAAAAAAAAEEAGQVDEGPPDFEGDGDGGGGLKEKRLVETLLGDDDEADAREELSKATPPRTFGPASPLQVNPPPPTTDNIHPKVTLNKVELTPTKKSPAAGAAVGKKPAEKKGSIGDGIPDVDELAKRFAALKR